MPYLFKVGKRFDMDSGVGGVQIDPAKTRAVATLEEATEALDTTMKVAGASGDTRLIAICKLSESGGTVGPLPRWNAHRS